jgi:hypothetical protein
MFKTNRATFAQNWEFDDAFAPFTHAVGCKDALSCIPLINTTALKGTPIEESHDRIR